MLMYVGKILDCATGSRVHDVVEGVFHDALEEVPLRNLAAALSKLDRHANLQTDARMRRATMQKP